MHRLDRGPPGQFWLLGHRGLRAHDPRENTTASFDDALAAGADGVELDLRRTRDGAWFLHHDAHLDVEGEPTRILELAAGKLPPSLQTIQGLLDWAKQRPESILDVEVKESGRERELAALVRPLAPRMVVTSFVVDALAALHAADNRLVLGFLAPDDSPESIATARGAGCQWIAWRDRDLSPKLADNCRRAGMRMMAWDVQDRARAEKLASWGVEVIITDEVARLATTKPRPVKARH